MNRSDLVLAVSNRENVPLPTVEQVLSAVLDLVGTSLSLGDEVNIRTFGKFEPRDHAAVARRNPKTGEPVSVPAKTAIGFIPAPALKDKVNGKA